MNIDITQIANVIVALFSAIITGVIIPVARERLSQSKREKLDFWVKTAVEAAEQLFGSGKGQEKKEYVVSFLLSKGIVFDVDEVTNMIESAVLGLNEKLSKAQ